jgi:hypothetical protein
LPRHAQPTAALDFDGPSGQRVTLSQLPPTGCKSWSVSEKVLVVAAVRHGMLTFFEACERYDLSLDQFLDWQRTFDEVWPTWDRDRLQ